MFPSQHSNNLNPSIIHPDIFQIGNPNTLLTANNHQNRGRRSKSCLQGDDDDDDDSGNQLSKKLTHRETERQRRQEMASLYASLRSLLPTEYIRGKRSTSDHMNEAVRYIKNVQMDIDKLRIRSEDLKKMKKNSGNGSSKDVSSLESGVMVNSCGGGIEILVNCGVKEGIGFPISKVFEELFQREVSVASCVSSRTEEGFLYRIQSEVNDLTYIDLSELQNRLAKIIEQY